MEIGDLKTVALIFVVSGIALGIGAQVLGTIQSQVSAGAATWAVMNATGGINQLASWLPTIGLVLAASLIIGIVVKSFIG